jgi:16S rRNA (uracil1498-N3)-methyltransferase
MASLLRLCVDLPLNVGTGAGFSAGLELELPAAAVRHVQVRRLQPGDMLHLFDGRGHEVEAQVLQMGRQHTQVRLMTPVAVLPELPTAVTLALGVPANERMDSLVEKATELGVARIQPLTTERSVLRLDGERAQRRVAHWLAIARAAAEQCGRATVPEIADWARLPDWLQAQAKTRAGASGVATGSGELSAAGQRWLLSPGAGAAQVLRPFEGPAPDAVFALSGPEGGLTAAEESAAQAAGFKPVSLGARVLRADTAPLAVMAWLSLQN